MAGVAGGMHASSALAAFAIAVSAVGIEAHAHVEHAVVVEHESCTRLGIAQFNLGLNLVAVVAGYEHQRRGIAGDGALGLQADAAIYMLDALWFVGAIGFPFQSYTELTECLFRAALDGGAFAILNGCRDCPYGVGTESLMVSDNRAEPSVFGHFQRFEKRLAS